MLVACECTFLLFKSQSAGRSWWPSRLFTALAVSLLACGVLAAFTRAAQGQLDPRQLDPRQLDPDGTVSGHAWSCYTIDDSLCGADGVKMADINADGLVDLVVGWEESGQVRVYLHPGRDKVSRAWPRIDLGVAPAVEDAVFVDLNADSCMDVLSCCEGQEQALRIHLNPCTAPNVSLSKAWRTMVVPDSRGKTRWMFAQPLPSSASRMADEEPERRLPLPEIVVGSKNPNGMLGILRTAATKPSEWRIEKLTEAEWIMSIKICDMDADGDADILYSDRKGKDSGVYWLENPNTTTSRRLALGAESEQKSASWPKHLIGALGREVMFMDVQPSPLVNSNRLETLPVPERIFVCVKPNWIYQLDRPAVRRDLPEAGRGTWKLSKIEIIPQQRIGNAKGIATGDLDGDGQYELVLSFEGAVAEKLGVVYLKQNQSGEWKMFNISGIPGIKYDFVRLLDIDLDGDLDVLTCEEREANCGLGVIWYANPMNRR